MGGVKLAPWIYARMRHCRLLIRGHLPVISDCDGITQQRLYVIHPKVTVKRGTTNARMLEDIARLERMHFCERGLTV
jgi:hypothetical protein